jgi:hypothetical protein
MSVSRERLREAAARTAFREAALEKVIRLGEITRPASCTSGIAARAAPRTGSRSI